MKPVLMLTFGIALVSAAGCSDGRPVRVKVSGQVQIDGKPLTHGFVQVLPNNDRAASGKIGTDGRFTLTTYEPNDGCVPGKHRACVVAVEPLGATKQRWHAPKRYANPESAGLEVDVPKETDALVIKLSWEGGQPFEELFASEGPTH